MIRRLNLIEAQIQYLFLNTIYLARIQTRQWKYGLPVIFSDADEDVAAVQVMEVIGKSTERVQYSRWVPSLLELEPLGLDGARVQDIFDVDRKSHRIILEPSLACSSTQNIDRFS